MCSIKGSSPKLRHSHPIRVSHCIGSKTLGRLPRLRGKLGSSLSNRVRISFVPSFGQTLLLVLRKLRHRFLCTANSHRSNGTRPSYIDIFSQTRSQVSWQRSFALSQSNVYLYATASSGREYLSTSTANLSPRPSDSPGAFGSSFIASAFALPGTPPLAWRSPPPSPAAWHTRPPPTPARWPGPPSTRCDT